MAARDRRDGMNGRRAGRVTLVGAGPGDPGLLTERGRAALMAADDVVYDALVSERIVASCGARRHYVGKRAGDRGAAAGRYPGASGPARPRRP